jgi:hypothetical protein
VLALQVALCCGSSRSKAEFLENIDQMNPIRWKGRIKKIKIITKQNGFFEKQNISFFISIKKFFFFTENIH